MRLPPGSGDDGEAQRKPGSPSQSRMGQAGGEAMGGTPFSNFRKIVCVRASSRSLSRLGWAGLC